MLEVVEEEEGGVHMGDIYELVLAQHHHQLIGVAQACCLPEGLQQLMEAFDGGLPFEGASCWSEPSQRVEVIDF